MGIFDKAKDIAGKAKDKADDVVEQNADKIPDPIEKAYDKVSDVVEKVIPGADGTADDAEAEATEES